MGKATIFLLLYMLLSGVDVGLRLGKNHEKNHYEFFIVFPLCNYE